MTSSPTITSTTTLANATQTDSVSVTPDSFNRGGISQLASSPSPKREASQHQDVTKEYATSSPSKHISKVLEAGAKKIGLVKKRRSPPSHYLSLPVGGTASSAANGMYMLHSEDLSVTEFAKLAGITILPEEGENDTTTSEEISPNESSITSQGMTRRGTGSTGNTSDSDKHLTSGSMGSNKLLKKTNIWDPQFWTIPSQDGASQSVAPSLSSSSLPLSPVSISAPASPSLAPLMAVLEISDISRQLIGPMDSGSSIMFNSTAPESGGHENAPLLSQNTPHGRRGSCSHCELKPGAGSSLVANRGGFTSPAVPPKRVDLMSNPSKEAVELSRSLSREMSYTSLTAVAIELRSDQDPKKSAEETKSEDYSVQQGTKQQQQQFRDVEVAPPAIRLEPSEPTTEQAGNNPQSQRLAYSVAFHALQPARSKPSAYRRPSLHLGSSKAARARSPSPSPLSRQLEMSDSEGFDSPMEEKDEFDFKVTPAGSTPVGSAPQIASTDTPAPRNSRFEISHSAEDTDTESDSMGPTNEKHAVSLYHHRTQSLPHILSDHPEDVDSQSSSSTPLPTQSQPASPRPPNSDPIKKFTPGTKVGRFTLVQETCTKHVDILRAQQEQDQYKQSTSQRRVSMGDMDSSRFYSDDESDHSVEIENLTGTKAQRRYSTAFSVEGAAMEWVNPTLRPEENVVIFQRRRVRRLQQQQQPQPQLGLQPQ
ncbi:hypothetical protein BGX26_001118 [Mortierella sp. AD094]|nr:hypothetical protein BGX26_001118 [Mortierella sp. AD094]